MGARLDLHVPLQRAGRHASSARSTSTPWENCGFETVAAHEPGRLRVGPRGDRGRPAHLLRARDRLRGQRRPAGDLHLAAARRGRRSSPPAPASRPAPRASPPPAARSRAPRPRSTSSPTSPTRRSSARSTSSRSTPCTSPVHYTGLLQGDHELRVVATDAERRRPRSRPRSTSGRCSSRSTTRRPRRRSSARRPTAAARRSSSSAAPTTRRRPSLLTLRVPHRQHERARLGGRARTRTTCSTTTPTRDFQLAPGPHVFEVRAIDAFEPLVPDPSNPDFEGNVDPSPVRYVWTSTAGRRARPAPASPPARAAAPARPRRRSSSSAPTTRRPAHLMEFECSLDGAPFEPCSSPETVSLEPGTHTLPDARRSTSPATSTRRPPSARGRSSAAPVATITSGPERPHPARPAGPPAPSTAGAARSSRSPPTSPTRRSSARSTAPSSSPARRRTWRSRVDRRRARVRGPRRQRRCATVDGEPIVQEPATSYEWRVGARPRHDAAGHDDHLRAAGLDARLDRDVPVHRHRQPHAAGADASSSARSTASRTTAASRPSSSPT